MKQSHPIALVVLFVFTLGSCGSSAPDPIPVSAFAETIRAGVCSSDAARAVYENLRTCWDLVESTDVERDSESGAWVLHIGVTELVAKPSNVMSEIQIEVVCQLASFAWPDWVVLDDPDGKPLRWDASLVPGELACTPDETAFRANVEACECEIPTQDELVETMKARPTTPYEN